MTTASWTSARLLRNTWPRSLSSILSMWIALIGLTAEAVRGQTGAPPAPETSAAGSLPADYGPHSYTPFVEEDYFGDFEYGGYFEGGCPPSWLVVGDAFILNREGDSGNSLSSAHRLDDFGYETGIRVSVNRRFDCLVGWEAAFVGPLEWEQNGASTGAGFMTSLGPAGINLSAFNNAVSHTQSYRSRFYSGEFNQRWWGWDVISTYVGARYIGVEEDYLFQSTNNLAQFGQLGISTNNHLVGGQAGIDLFQPIGRLASTIKTRAGLYANILDSTVLLQNAGTVQVNNSADDADVAVLLETGYYLSYQLTRHIAIRGGYEVMWLYGLALAPQQLTNPVSANSGNRVDRDGDVFYHGGTVGVEITW